MKKMWIILYVVLFMVIVFALHLEGLGFVLLTIGHLLDAFRVKKDKMEELKESVENRQKTIDALNEKIDNLLKNQEDLLTFRSKFNDLYKNEVLGDSKS